MMLFSSAIAADSGATSIMGSGGLLESFVPLLLIVVIFYFMLIRPQHKRMKAHQLMLSQLKRGDKVVTSSGIIGISKKLTTPSFSGK